MNLKLGAFVVLVLRVVRVLAGDESCDSSALGTKKFLLYGVNPGEGFNLARDVYVRVAAIVRHLLKHEDWTLVLPPWGPMYHWMKAEELSGVRQTDIRWARFFDVPSLNRYVPVVELDDFVSGPYASSTIDVVCVLQRFAEGWDSSPGGWVDKWEPRECLDATRYDASPDGDGSFVSWFWGRRDYFRAKNVSCVSFQGRSANAAQMVRELGKRVVMLDRAETVLHDAFGDAQQWSVRRSMRFATHLLDVAAKFRRRFLNSTDAVDATVLPADWRDFRPQRGTARGGPYLAVHLRRNDFLYGAGSRTPSLRGAAERIRAEMARLGLTRVFVATDGSGADVGELRERLEPVFEVFVFQSTPERIKKFHAGGVAIIDQIICSRARHFIGTSESTFSFRIQEEREILGFPTDSTFNVFCPDDDPGCGGSTKWLIQYP